MLAKKIHIGSDHGGFELKQALAAHLKKEGFSVKDHGTFNTESCDYPDFAVAAAEGAVSEPDAAGVVICKSGIGVSMAANKVSGARAALCRTREDAVMSRRHNNANVLALGAAQTDAKTAEEIFDAWIREAFEGGRHERRVEKMKQYEEER